MPANRPAPDWASAAASFLSDNLPRYDGAWDHMFMTAYQIGCETLVALGHAEETPRGAIPSPAPTLPKHLPRWDDICVAVLWLAEQQNKLVCCLPDGTLPPRSGTGSGFVITVRGLPPPPSPNILSAHGLGAARAEPDVVHVLTALGLVANERWTRSAEPVLWRDQPHAWKMDIVSDPRFAEAVRIAVESIPSDVRMQIERLVTITDEDVDLTLALHAAAREEATAKYGPKAQVGRPMTRALARRSLQFQRLGELDWVFFRGWRLDDGWLASQQKSKALGIFHDPLAAQMRRAVVAALHPGLSDFSQ